MTGKGNARFMRMNGVNQTAPDEDVERRMNNGLSTAANADTHGIRIREHIGGRMRVSAETVARKTYRGGYENQWLRFKLFIANRYAIMTL